MLELILIGSEVIRSGRVGVFRVDVFSFRVMRSAKRIVKERKDNGAGSTTTPLVSGQRVLVLEDG